MRPIGLFMAAGLAAALGGAADAADLAVIVTNEDYRTVRDAETGVDRDRVGAALEAAGFEVETLRDASAERLQSWFFERRTRMEEADRLIVLVAGHVVTNGRDAWLLGTDAGRVSVFDAGSEGLPLSVLEPFLAAKPGSAMLLVGSPGSQSAGSGLELGYLPPPEVPQGVTVLAGPGGDLSDLLVEDILGAGRPVGAALAAREGGEAVGYGFLPRMVGFLPQSAEDRSAADIAAWEVADAEDSEAGYEGYLDRFPTGLNVAEAEARLRELRLSPEAKAAAEEEGLGLDRDTRREMQRILTLLGYETRGIDGIFGRGTRTAMRDWQADEGLEPTGYLTGNQVTLLRELGGTRQSELEAEAERRREEAERADDAYWDETGRGADEAGLRRYLERYPDGLYSAAARTRLADIEAERQAGAAEGDRRDWEAAQAADGVAAYEEYLAAHPDGAFAAEAEARIGELRLEDGRQAELDEARAEEARILANPVTRLLVERRLQQLDLEPGPADGTFDDDTRRAIRNYQRARELPVTGFVSQKTLVRLLAG